MKNKIMILGKCGSGKSTISDYLVENYGFKRYAFADELKIMTREVERSKNLYRNSILRKHIEDLISPYLKDMNEEKITKVIDSLNYFKLKNPTKRSWNIRSVLRYIMTGNKPLEIKNRGLLQEIGMFFRTEFDYEIWVKFLYKKINSESKNKNVVIDDARFQNEFKYFKSKQYKVIRVNCDIEKRKQRMLDRDGKLPTEKQMNHISEIDLDCFGLKDGIKDIGNNGELESLYCEIDNLVKG